MFTSDPTHKEREVFRPRGTLRGCGSSIDNAHLAQLAAKDCAASSGKRAVILSLITALFIALSAVVLPAQTRAVSTPASGFGPVYDATQEITVTGTVDQVVTQHTEGSPAGMHLLVASSQGLVDAHVGPFLSEQTKSALQKGVPLQMVGAMLSLHGKDYLLVRQLTVAGRTVILRSPHGLLVRERVPGEERPARARKSQKSAVTQGGL
jgi:hypothetical protein